MLEQLRAVSLPEKLIPLTIINALEGRPLPVYGRGENVRDWLHVEDHAAALELILTSGKLGESYNVGGRAERSNLQVVETICDLLDGKQRSADGRSRRDLIDFVADRPGHDRRYAIDPSKIERELGWRIEQTFESGLAATVDWFLDNEWWWRPIREGRYRRRSARHGLVKVLVTGSEGQLAQSLNERGNDHPLLELLFAARPDTDLSIPGSVAKAIETARPDLVINAAAYTDVDRAEDEPELAFRINAEAAGEAAAGSFGHRRVDHPAVDRLCVRRQEERALCRGRSRPIRSTSMERPS